LSDPVLTPLCQKPSNRRPLGISQKTVDTVRRMFLHKNIRHVIPPNPYLVNPTIDDVIRAGPVVEDQPTVSLPVTLFSVRGKSETTTLPAVGKGKILPFNVALLYVPDAAVESHALKLFLEAVAHPILGVASEALFPGLGLIQRSLLEAQVHAALFPEHQPDPYRELAEGLEENGVTVMPIVRLIGTEFEKHVFSPLPADNPLTLSFGDEKEALLLSFYGFSFEWATQLVGLRRISEQAQMLWHVVNEMLYRPVITKAVENKLTLEQLQSELEGVGQTNLLQNAPQLCRRQLDLLAPMLPAYRKLPFYDVWLQDLEMCAAGDVNRLPIPQFYVGDHWAM
jgi:hypothetical protein